MDIQLEFTNPVYVSTAEIKCQIEIVFGDGSLFKSAGFDVPLPEGTLKSSYLSKQMRNGSAEKALEAAGSALKALLEFLSSAGPIGNFFFGASSSQLWSMIEGMQLIVMYPLLQVDAP